MRIFSLMLRVLFLTPVFCLGAMQWPVPPTTISTPGVNAVSPYAAVGPNGNTVAVWLENNVVMASSFTAGTWSAPATVSAFGAATPRAVMDANGNATAIWAENGVIKVANKPLAGSWSSSTTLSGSGASAPRIGVDSSGDLVAVWVENGVIKSSTKLFGGSWNIIPDTLSLDSASSSPSLAVNASGAVVAVWQEPVLSNPTIFAATKQIGGIWGVSTAISLGNNNVYPQVAIDANGDITAAWFQYSFANNQYFNVILLAAQKPVGQTWVSQGAPVSIGSTVSIRNPADLSLSVVYNGTSPLLTWTSSTDGSTFNIEQAMYTALGGWNEHPFILDNNWGVYAVSSAVGPVGNNGVAWMQIDPVTNHLLVEGTATTYGGFEDFVWETWIFSHGGDNAYPMVVAGGTLASPAGILIWENYNGSNTSIQTIAAPVRVVQPPTGVSVVQQGTNYGVLTRYDNVLNWTASVSPGLFGYAINRNNIPIAVLDASITTYADINQDSNAPVSYQIAAINLNGVESSFVTVSLP